MVGIPDDVSRHRVARKPAVSSFRAKKYSNHPIAVLLVEKGI